MTMSGTRRFDQLTDRLSGGDRRSIGEANAVVSEVLVDSALFPLLVRALEYPDEIVRMRAADAIEKITISRPDLLRGYEAHMIDRIAATPQQEVRWHVAQIIPRLNLDSIERERALAILTGYLNDRSRIVQTFAMQALADLARDDQDLRRRVLPMLEQLAVTGSPAVRSRGRRLVAQLREDGQ